MRQEPTGTWWSMWPRALRVTIAGLGALYALLIASTLVRVLSREPHPATPVIESKQTVRGTDLADYRRGARIVVSSYHVRTHHHPLFAIDGQRSKDELQKWTSAESDENPWLEVIFPSPSGEQLSTVRLVHAGYTESDHYTARDYTIRCFSENKRIVALAVRNNEAAIAEHSLPCTRAQRLRIDFERPDDVVRLYEVEALGGG